MSIKRFTPPLLIKSQLGKQNHKRSMVLKAALPFVLTRPMKGSLCPHIQMPSKITAYILQTGNAVMACRPSDGKALPQGCRSLSRHQAREFFCSL